MRFWRDWRIKANELTFDKMLASGAEGQVWLGHLQDIGEVAIKVPRLVSPSLLAVPCTGEMAVEGW